ncbi:hypothetical protein DFH11DRAFT_626465 [Phellopilus nigrolimitatus]|nr:hypothetical protein DFH11DRAFT_626465 [Phellopilus nigrolimitatus]
MSSLRVTLPARLDLYVKGRAELYLLGAPDLTSASQGALHATVTSKIRAGYHTAIYRAILATQGDETNVVLKFYLEENSIADLKREAAVYTGQLRDLQGVVIPRYYGLYVGGNEGECGFACIVLEDCGECLKDLFEKHSIEERIEILNQLAEVHKKEFVPHGFEEENVVGEPGAYRLIGLRDAHQTDHKCGFDGQWHVGGMIPYNKHTCNWLLYRGKAMRIYDK